MTDISVKESNRKEVVIPGLKLETVVLNSTEDKTSIKDRETGDIYADGWYYIQPGDTDLGLKNSYIINPETGDIVRYDDQKHKIVDNKILGVKEGLVYTADAKNIEDDGSWGDAKLHNFVDGEPNSGWSENALMFDGKDDGIEVQDDTDYSNGITLEIYMKLRGPTNNQIVQILMMKRTSTANGFFMFLGNTNGYRYGDLQIDIGGSGQRYVPGITIQQDVPTYLSYTYNPKASSEKGILYIDGAKRASTNLGDINKLMEVRGTTIQIGSDIHAYAGGNNTYPFNGEIYATRVYNRPLSATEVKQNYDAITSYH